jgi:alpha-tubulin suppressor-like RCC1 family protein
MLSQGNADKVYPLFVTRFIYTRHTGTTLEHTLFMPKEVLFNALVKKIASVDDWCLAITCDGSVWGWGDNSKGQLGHTNIDHCPTPTHISLHIQQEDGESNAVAVACGGGHGIALTENGTVWVWGLNNLGQLGLGEELRGTYSPRPLSFFLPQSSQDRSNEDRDSKVVLVGAGKVHSVFVRTDGTVWISGDDQFGNLASKDKPVNPCFVPTKKEDLSLRGVQAAGLAVGGFHTCIFTPL